jgi:hypothetical protein
MFNIPNKCYFFGHKVNSKILELEPSFIKIYTVLLKLNQNLQESQIELSAITYCRVSPL